MPYLPNGTFIESIEEYKIRLAKKKDTKMKILARWESKRGKHWVEAIQYDDDVMYGLPLFGFRADGAVGSGYKTAEEAIKRAALEASFYSVVMRRVV